MRKNYQITGWWHPGYQQNKVHAQANSCKDFPECLLAKLCLYCSYFQRYRVNSLLEDETGLETARLLTWPKVKSSPDWWTMKLPRCFPVRVQSFSVSFMMFIFQKKKFGTRILFIAVLYFFLLITNSGPESKTNTLCIPLFTNKSS